MPIPLTNRRRKASEDGFVLIAAMIMLAVFVIAMSVALPRISSEIQRDREVETMHRGKQYVRGIQLYFHKFQSYPPNLDALVKTNEIRFIRKKYIDPVTGKDDWKPIQYCQNKTPTAMGFFGQPLAGAMGCGMGAGTGPGGGNGINGATPASSLNGNSATGSPTSGLGSAGGMGSSPFSNSIGSSGIGSSVGSSGIESGGIGSGGISSNTGMNGGISGTSPTGATPGADGTQTASTDANGTPIGGTTFGGAGIVGVSPASPKQSILVYKKKTHYNEWEFLYDPAQEMQMMAGGNAGSIGQPAGSGTTFAPGSNSPGSFGPGGNNGSTPIPPPSATTPQQ